MSLKRRILFNAAMFVVACSTIVGLSGATAGAAVTNCTKYTYFYHAQGICTATNGNYPYTTQFRMVVPCWNPTQQTSPRGYGPWRYARPYVNQSSYSDAWCPSGSYVYGTPYFQFQ
jgi:hypothetical protein